MGKVVERVKQLVEPIVEEHGLELYDLEFVKEANNWFLRIFIDSTENEVGLDQCTAISRILSDLLDQEDPIKQGYLLEVSTPGIERVLKKLADFDRFTGSPVYIKTYQPINHEKEFTGILRPREGEEIKLDKKGEVVVIPFSSIAKAHLAGQFG